MGSAEPNLQLPAELPAGWLKEIKDAVKQSWARVLLTTVLGSSVIGSGVTFGGNYWIETTKAKREMIKKGHEEALEAYGNLGKKVEELETALGTAVLTFEYAVQSGAVKSSKHPFIKVVDNSIEMVLPRMADIVEASTNVRIDDASIKKNTDSALDELAQYLEKSLSDKSALHNVIELFRSKLSEALKALRRQIEEKRNSIRIES